MITNMEKTNKLRATPADRFEDDVDVEAAETICGVETNAGEAVGVLNFTPRKKPSKFLRASGGQGFQTRARKMECEVGATLDISTKLEAFPKLIANARAAYDRDDTTSSKSSEALTDDNGSKLATSLVKPNATARNDCNANVFVEVDVKVAEVWCTMNTESW